MLYNYNLPFKELEQKRIKLAEYGVQIMDSRYKPLNCTNDGYNPYKKHQEPGSIIFIRNGLMKKSDSSEKIVVATISV